MRDFVARTNIANFEKQLQARADPVQAKLLRELLVLETTKLLANQAEKGHSGSN